MGILNIAVRLLGSQTAIKDMDGLGGSMARFADGMATATAAGLLLQHELDQVLTKARRVELAEEAFVNLGLGIANTEEKLGGFVSRQQVLMARNRSMQLGLNLTAEEFSRMAEAAAKAGLVMGQDVNQSINDIILGVGRQSRLILDNLGIIVRVDKANQDYAESVGKVVGQLTEAEKKAAFKKAALDALQRSSEGVTLEAKTAAAQWEIYKNRLSDAADNVALMVSESALLGKGIQFLSKTMDDFNKTEQLKRMRTDLAKMSDEANVARERIRELNVTFTKLGEAGASIGHLGKTSLVSDEELNNLLRAGREMEVIGLILEKISAEKNRPFGPSGDELFLLERMERQIKKLVELRAQMEGKDKGAFILGVGDDAKKLALQKEKVKALADEEAVKERLLALNQEIARSDSFEAGMADIEVRTAIAKATEIQSIKLQSQLKWLRANAEQQKLLEDGMTSEESTRLFLAKAMQIEAEELKALQNLRGRGRREKERDTRSRAAALAEINLLAISSKKVNATDLETVALDRQIGAMQDNLRIRELEKTVTEEGIITTLKAALAKQRKLEFDKAEKEVLDEIAKAKQRENLVAAQGLADQRIAMQGLIAANQQVLGEETKQSIIRDRNNQLAVIELNLDKKLLDSKNHKLDSLNAETARTNVLFGAKQRLMALEAREAEERRRRIEAAAQGFQGIAGDLMDADARMTAFRVSESKKRINATVRDENKRAFLIAKAEHKALVAHKKATQHKAMLGAAMQAARSVAAFAIGDVAGSISHAAAAAQFGIAAALAGGTVPSFVAPRRKDTTGRGGGARREAAAADTKTFVTINVAPGGIASPETAGVVLQGMIDASAKFGRGISSNKRVERI